MPRKSKDVVLLTKVGLFLRFKRQQNNYSRKLVAEKLNVSQQQIAKYEYGRDQLNISRLIDYLKLFKCSYDEFFTSINELNKIQIKYD